VGEFQTRPGSGLFDPVVQELRPTSLPYSVPPFREDVRPRSVKGYPRNDRFQGLFRTPFSVEPSQKKVASLRRILE